MSIFPELQLCELESCALIVPSISYFLVWNPEHLLQTTFWFAGFVQIKGNTKYSNDIIECKFLNRVSHSPLVARCVEEKKIVTCLDNSCDNVINMS